MTTRVLPPEEWPRLVGTLLESAWPHFTPAETRVIVVERGERIVGCAALFQAWHLDGVWTAAAERGHISAARRLVQAIRGFIRDRQIREVAMMAVTPESRRLCNRLLGPARLLACDHLVANTEGVWLHDR